MKTVKINRYQLGIRRTFPTTHPQKGKPTYFVEKIQLGLGLITELPGDCVIDLEPKLHILRANNIFRTNVPLWKKRMEEVMSGHAIIELFYWEGNPCSNKQVVFAVLDKDSGCGVQKIYLKREFFKTNWVVDQSEFQDQLLSTIAKNDGLSLDDFKEYFKSYDLSKPMEIIQFTKFRYK